MSLPSPDTSSSDANPDFALRPTCPTTVHVHRVTYDHARDSIAIVFAHISFPEPHLNKDLPEFEVRVVAADEQAAKPLPRFREFT